MIVTQLAWNPPYSPTTDTISELGVVRCGQLVSPETGAALYVCSPWHVVFNASTIAFGVLLVLGALLVAPGFRQGRLRTLGLGLLSVAGAGAVGVGLSPVDVNGPVHAICSLLVFLGGGVAVLALGRVMTGDPRWEELGAYSMGSGAVALAAVGADLLGVYGPLGVGGIERVIVVPVFLWLVIVGAGLTQLRAFTPAVGAAGSR